MSTVATVVITPRSSAGRAARAGRRPRRRPRRAGCPTSAPLTSARSAATSSSVEHLAEVDDPLVDPAGVGDQHEHQPGGGERDDLAVPHRGAGERRVLHDGHLPGELGEQPHAAAHDVVEVDRAVEERLHRPPLGRRQRLDLRQPVDEQAVALVGGHPARAGVRLGDVARPPPARPCRCARWRWRRRGCAARRSSSSRRAPAWPRSRRRSRAGPRSGARRRSYLTF